MRLNIFLLPFFIYELRLNIFLLPSLMIYWRYIIILIVFDVTWYDKLLPITVGGWGKPPVDETGKPLYGDVFGTKDEAEAEPVSG